MVVIAGIAATPTLGPEEALVDFQDAGEGRQIALLGGGGRRAEEAEIPAHRPAVLPQQQGRL